MKRKEFLGLSGLMMAGAALPGRLAFGEMKEAASGPAKLDARIFEVKMQYAWTLSRGTWNVRQNVLLRLEKDGVAGMGESAPIARYNESAGAAWPSRAGPSSAGTHGQHRWNEIDAVTRRHAIKAALDMS
jgi:L-alanine-DL-glutamate epimerase-like enolase superfamily enzyme